MSKPVAKPAVLRQIKAWMLGQSPIPEERPNLDYQDQTASAHREFRWKMDNARVQISAEGSTIQASNSPDQKQVSRFTYEQGSGFELAYPAYFEVSNLIHGPVQAVMRLNQELGLDLWDGFPDNANYQAMKALAKPRD